MIRPACTLQKDKLLFLPFTGVIARLHPLLDDDHRNLGVGGGRQDDAAEHALVHVRRAGARNEVPARPEQPQGAEIFTREFMP